MQQGVDIATAVAVLRRGGLVGMPTETVYGLAADAANPAAVAQIFAAKGRPSSHPLIVHLGDAALLAQWASDVSLQAQRLANAFWPGPLTLIVARHAAVSPTVTGGAATVGVRVPSHPMALALLREFGGGLAAPSANRFGSVSPTTAAHVARELGERVDYILDGGPCTVGVESTIVDVSQPDRPPTLLRPGGVPRAAIEAIVGPLAAPSAVSPVVSGSLASHYAPRATVVVASQTDVPAVVHGAIQGRPNARVGVMAPAAWLAQWHDAQLGTSIIRCSLPDDDAGIARALYAALRDLDDTGVELIVAALPQAIGLGEAVIDRLQRAAGPRA
ncbi:MAG TPA: L-threonylcarbamoyladenylate synthase [Kofleriaceae bacterium]|nr:L-threonylcarbamoyladenylate synthase [Kofleriaceae bacterium]